MKVSHKIHAISGSNIAHGISLAEIRKSSGGPDPRLDIRFWDEDGVRECTCSGKYCKYIVGWLNTFWMEAKTGECETI